MAPFVPTSVKATNGADASFVTITWPVNDSRMTDMFTVWRCTNDSIGSCAPFGSRQEARDLYNNGYAYVDYPPKKGTLYYYRVSACAMGLPMSGEIDWNKTEYSAFSAPDFGWAGSTPPNVPQLPATPDAPKASDGLTGKVSVTWSSVPEATFYMLFRDGFLLAEVNGTSYLDESPENCIKHLYRLKACNDVGCGEMSEGDIGQQDCKLKSGTIFILIQMLSGSPFL